MAKRRTKQKSSDQVKLIDYDRAIFVQGNLDDSLISTLTPKILALRKDSESPITVFIDSPGGSVVSGAIIRGLLKTPDQMGRTCWVNSVVTGQACSAAADLLTLGDYIISYPNAYIHFHGTGTRGEEITNEQAGHIQEELLSVNKSAAVRLATTVFDRMLSNYFSFKDQLHIVRDALEEQLRIFEVLVAEGTIDVPAFVFYLIDKVKDPYKGMLMHCIDKTSQMSIILNKYREEADKQRQLSPSVRAALKKVQDDEEKSEIIDEITMLNVILASKINNNPKWRLTTEDFNELEQDFIQLNAMEYFQDEGLDRLIRFGDLFIPPKDMKFFRRYTYEDTEDPKIKAKADEIIDRAYGKIEPLWAFSLTLCRELTAGEYPISPEDAWWLGLIDEVLGSPSLTRRVIGKKVKSLLIGKLSIHDFVRFVE